MTVEPATKQTIIIVDDEKNVRDLFIRYLKAENFNCLTASNGNEALDILAAEEIPLMLCDINMDGMSGIDLLNIARKKYPELAVIMVSGVDDRNVARMALELGASGYLIKPVPRTSLIIQVLNALRLRELSLSKEANTRMLIHQEKLAAIGRLAAGIIHELNTPTTYIRGNLQTFARYSASFNDYLKKMAANPEKEELENIRKKMATLLETTDEISAAALKGTERIMNIVSSMRGFVVDSHRDKTEINIFQPMIDALILTRNRFKHIGRATLDGHKFKDINPKNFVVRNRLLISANSQRLCQLFVILFNNSIDAWQTFANESQKEQASFHLEISIRKQEDGNVICQVRDNSGGMEADTAVQVFEPFFTTKEGGKGTGLGMSICQQIVREHNGKIFLKNYPGSGVCWNISFPA